MNSTKGISHHILGYLEVAWYLIEGGFPDTLHAWHQHFRQEKLF